jgi:hypothetical protein
MSQVRGIASTCDTMAARSEEPFMRLIAIGFAASVLSSLAFAVAAAAPPPVPPTKVGLWEIRMVALDAAGHEVTTPEQAALAKMSPEVRARMAEGMKARGVSLPDANGATKVCLTKELYDSGSWQQLASDTGCTTTFSTQTSTTWKWHSSCTKLKSESDGETVFSSAERYKTKVTTTTAVTGTPKTSTRILEGKWISADCGDVKPLTPPPTVRK